MRIVGGVDIINVQIVTSLGREIFLSEFFYGDVQALFCNGCSKFGLEHSASFVMQYSASSVMPLWKIKIMNILAL